MSDLKPCPFCGSEAKFVFRPCHQQSHREAGIWCRNRKCLIHVWHRFENTLSDEEVKQELAELWNRRVWE